MSGRKRGFHIILALMLCFSLGPQGALAASDGPGEAVGQEELRVQTPAAPEAEDMPAGQTALLDDGASDELPAAVTAAPVLPGEADELPETPPLPEEAGAGVPALDGAEDPPARAGSCGDGLAWALEGGVLTISGTGTMSDAYDSWSDPFPWASFAEEITGIVLSEGVRSASASAFVGFKALTDVSIPVSMESIGEGCFSGCTALRSVTYGGDEAGWRGIAIGAGNGPLLAAAPYAKTDAGTFGGLTWALDGVTLTVSGSGAVPSAETGSPWGLHYDLVQTLVIEPGVTGIGDYAFENFSAMKRAVLPEGLAYIGNYAFAGCESLAQVQFPAGLRAVGAQAFSGCAMAELRLPEGLELIGDYAFMSCRKLERTELPASLSTMGNFVFEDCPLFASAAYAGTEDAWNAISFGAGNGVLWKAAGFVPRRAGTYGALSWSLDGTTLTVTGSGPMPADELAPWFSYNDIPQAIVIGEGVTSVSDWAFAYAYGAESVTLPESVVSIGDYAFRACESLSGVRLPSALTRLGDHSFGYCTGLRSVSIPAGVDAVGEGTFEYCVSLGSISLAEGLTDVGAYAFLGCEALGAVTLPDSVTDIGASAFQECASLSGITLPAGIAEVAPNAFFQCASLSSVVIPEGVTAIGPGAFYECGGLSSVTLPASLAAVEGYAFQDCTRLAAVYFGGTRAQWDAIEIAEYGNEPLNSAAVYLRYDGGAAVRTELDDPAAEALLADAAAAIADGDTVPGVEELTPGALAAAAAAGKTITARAVVTVLDGDALPAAEAELITEKLGGGEALSFVDISVELLADGEVIGYLHETESEVRFTVRLSGAQLAALDGRGLFIVRVHDGAAEILTAAREGSAAVFETDRFSVYAVAACAHDWGGWTVTREADYAQAGERERVCAVCGETEKESIPVLARQMPAAQQAARSAQQRSPNTGDGSSAALWALLLIGCAAAAVLTRKRYRA